MTTTTQVAVPVCRRCLEPAAPGTELKRMPLGAICPGCARIVLQQTLFAGFARPMNGPPVRPFLRPLLEPQDPWWIRLRAWLTGVRLVEISRPGQPTVWVRR